MTLCVRLTWSNTTDKLQMPADRVFTLAILCFESYDQVNVMKHASTETASESPLTKVKQNEMYMKQKYFNRPEPMGTTIVRVQKQPFHLQQQNAHFWTARNSISVPLFCV